MAEHSYSRFLRQIQSFENSPQKTEFELRSDRLNQNEITRQRICNNFKVFLTFWEMKNNLVIPRKTTQNAKKWKKLKSKTKMLKKCRNSSWNSQMNRQLMSPNEKLFAAKWNLFIKSSMFENQHQQKHQKLPKWINSWSCIKKERQKSSKLPFQKNNMFADITFQNDSLIYFVLFVLFDRHHFIWNINFDMISFLKCFFSYICTQWFKKEFPMFSNQSNANPCDGWNCKLIIPAQCIICHLKWFFWWFTKNHSWRISDST